MIESFYKKDLEEQIDLYVNGQLSEKEIDELWAELIQDDYHLDYLKSVANIKAVVEEDRRKREAMRNRRTWTYAAAAAFILLVAVMALMNPSVFTQSTDLQPVESIELDYYRSSEGSISDTGNTIISRAITLANSGQFNEAVELLKQEIGNSEDPAWISELSLTLGSLYYNESRYEEALSHYERVITHRESVDVLTLEKAYWYMGNTYFQLDRMELAQQHMEQAYELNGAYRRVARSYLDALSD